jgi:hypothetical protein
VSITTPEAVKQGQITTSVDNPCSLLDRETRTPIAPVKVTGPGARSFSKGFASSWATEQRHRAAPLRTAMHKRTDARSLKIELQRVLFVQQNGHGIAFIAFAC